MPLRRSCRALAVAAAMLHSGWLLQATDDAAAPDVASLVARVGERVAAYYQRAQGLICSERSTVVPVGSDGVSAFSRTVESELRIEADGADGVQVSRDVQRVNGREPRDRDRTNRAGCTDPSPVSPELLAFLLPAQRDDYVFSNLRDGREHDRAAVIVDFASTRRNSRPELVEDEYGHDDCFDWKGPIATAGRLWIDAETHDVLRLDRRLLGPVDIRVPSRLQSKYRFEPWITIDRDDMSLRFRPVAFSDPEETLLLPDSIDSQTVMRSGLQSIRRTQVFSNYRRFLTSGRIKQLEPR